METFVENASGALSIVALFGGLAVLLIRAIAPRSRAGDLAANLVVNRRPITAMIAGWATLGSLYYSEVLDFVPCRLCWFQRTMMYPIAVIALIAWFRRDRASSWYIASLAAIGLGISLWHNLVELFPTLESDSCDFTAPCSVVYFRAFGVFSLATMAASGFFAILVLNTVRFPRPNGDRGSAD